MRKKDIFAKLIDILLPSSLLPFVLSLSSNKLTVLAYHRVSNVSKEDYEFDYELVSADADSFEAQIKYIKKYFNAITLEQLSEHIESGVKLPKNPLLITFDDGFEDNYSIAFPILKKHAVPATIFISTSLIGTSETIWFDKLAATVFACEDDKLVIEELNSEYLLGNTRETKEKVVAKILADIKLVSNDTRITILNNLSEKNQDSLKNVNWHQSRMMSWDNVREMQDSLISFGSHTVTHPILTQLNEAQLNHEIKTSKEVMERELGHTIDSISYPDGNKSAFDSNVIDEVIKCQYRIGFSYLPGINALPIKSCFDIKRLHVEHYVDKSHFKSLLCLPRLFGEA